MTVYNVTTAAELTAALNAAVGGDRIELAPGNYGSIAVPHSYASDVIVASADQGNPAEFSGVDFSGAARIVFEWLRFKSPGGQFPFVASGCSSITFRNSWFIGKISGGFGDGFGLHIDNSADLLIENCEFRDCGKALKLNFCDDWIVRACDFHSCSNDGMNVNGTRNGVIERNHFRDFHVPAGQGHNDFIQWWNPNSSRPVNGLIVRENFFDAGLGRSVQTIFGRNGAAEQNPGNTSVYFRNIEVRDNVIYNGHFHGITVRETIGLTILNNTLLRDAHAEGSTNAPQIRGSTNSQQVNTSLNILHKKSGSNWYLVQDTNPGGAGYYGDAFVDAMKPAPTLADLRAVSGGEIEQLGVGAAMTRADIPLIVGPGAAAPPPPPQNQGPVADFSFTATDLTTQFTDLSSDPDGAVVGWNWNLGDGQFSTEQNPTHTYGAPGTYDVILTVTDDDGASTASTPQAVTVSEPAPPPDPGAPVFQTGPHVFDGSIGSAQIFPHDAAYQVADGTIDLCFTVDTLVNRQAVFSKDATGFANGGHINVYLEQSNLIARIQDAGASYTVRADGAISAGQRYYAAVTFGAAGLGLWLDGVQVDADDFAGGLEQNSEAIVIGVNNWASTSGTTDKLREAMIGTVERTALYDRVLTAAEIAALVTGSAAAEQTISQRVRALEARVTRLERGV